MELTSKSAKLTSKWPEFTSKSAKLTSKSAKFTSKWPEFTSKSAKFIIKVQFTSEIAEFTK
ncbi:hypothetical protein [Peribacillus simplex]|uniref:hypothetical protein n=1 Tax=Peribacillus simplex TaxID=1478 RepID=UPI000BA649F4|nr:hypothetical protein [Peribacillus simplex]PAK39869.1 hypothetical protein CHI08_16630 [Peribacillus simplex]